MTEYVCGFYAVNGKHCNVNGHCVVCHEKETIMSNLVKFAHSELSRMGMGVDAPDEMNRLMGKQIIQIVKTFSKQGHSGFSANYATNIVDKLLRFEPLGPLTGDESEWMVISEDVGSADMKYQNVRCSHVFKRADGTAYDCEGRIFRDKDGSTWTNGKSRVEVTFPYTPTRKYVTRRWWKFWL